MADDELEYDDLYLDDGDNYFYIDDGYALADELAETSVPEPGVNDFSDDWDDLTRFEYFNDLEYDSDGFNDSSRTRTININHKNSSDAATGKKRKRVTSTRTSNATKRRRLIDTVSPSMNDLPLVLFKTQDSQEEEDVVDVSSLKPHSILPDWRQQFRDVKGIASVIANAKTVDMQDVDDQQMSDEDLDEEDALDASDATKALSVSLESKLADMGLDVSLVDQSKLLLLAQKMMSQDEEAEELLAEIIEGIHGAEDEEEKDPFAQWVAGNTTKDADDEQGSLIEDSSGSLQRDDSLVTRETANPGEALSPVTNGSPTRRKRKVESPQVTPRKRQQAKRRT